MTLQKKCIAFLFVLILSVTFVFAGSPFFGAQGDFTFPWDSSSTMSVGFGGGFMLEGGWSTSMLDLAVKAGYTGTSSDALVISLNEGKIGAAAALKIGHNMFAFLPPFICLRPELSVFADIYKVKMYRSESLKDRDISETDSGVTPVISAAITLDIPNIIKIKKINIVPYLGYGAYFRFDKQATIPSNTGILGMRVYIKNDKKEADKIDNAIPMELTAKMNSKYFSPDGDGIDDEAVILIESDEKKHGGISEWEINIFDAGKKLFYTYKSTESIPESFIWNGESSTGEKVLSASSYQYVITATAKDGAKGVIPGIINTDIMVTRKGDDLNIMLPSITFAPNAAGFEGIGESERMHNNELFDQVVVILERYKDYTIEISGHAHNVSGTEKENTEELIPLSEKRAQTVRTELARRGVKENRMTCVGKGSSEPLASGSDDVWKNRRVELTLKK